MNIPPVSIDAAKQALIEQYRDPLLRRRASMLWGSRGVGKSSIVRQVAEHHDVPLVDLRLTTIEPVDIRGAIYADDSFLEMGIIDSTGVLELIAHVESTYGVKIEDDELLPENLDSIDSLVSFISRKQTAVV